MAERECKRGGICGDEDRGWGVGGDGEEQDDKMVDKLCLECKPMGTRVKGKEHGDRRKRGYLSNHAFFFFTLSAFFSSVLLSELF